MTQEIERMKTIWNYIEIEIRYIPDYLKSYKASFGQLAHIEVQAKCPLPITETGYKSIFLSFGEVEEAGGALALVKAMLEKSAQSKDWQEYEKDQQQINLF